MEGLGTFPHNLDLHGTTDVDVAEAIAADKPFPDRPDATIELTHIGFSTTNGAPLSFDAAGLSVTAEFAAGISASVGIYPEMKSALAALALGETPGLTLADPGTADTRYALVTSHYSASGSLSGKHPIGAVGTLSIGATAASGGTLAVLHRFGKTEGAQTVLKTALKSWGLPRNVTDASALEPDTWLIAEVDGSIALNVAASVGYNVDFIRTVKAGTLSGDVGVKIDAAVAAKFGIDVSGRYVVVVGRETADERVRVRLFKLRRKGVSFGLDLKVGVTGVETVTPEKLDDLVASIFGVHGNQFITALHAIDTWTDPETTIGTLVAGLTDDDAQKLFKRLTGVTPKDAFNAAVTPVRDAIDKWTSLPQAVSSELWTVLRDIGVDGAKEQALKSGLAVLMQSDPEKQKVAFQTLLETDNFASSNIGRLLSAAADRGLLNLIHEPEALRRVAQTVNDILDGGIIAKLQQYIVEELNLQKVFEVVDQASFDDLNSWLVARLAALFDKELRFVGDLKSVRDAIRTVRERSNAIYDNARKALNSRYGLDVAGTWERTTADTAAFDVEFDTTVATGRQLLGALLRDAAFDQILVAPNPPVKIRTGVLTHELTRKSTINVTLPHVDLRTETLNEALATVEYVPSGSGVLGYQATGKDVVDAKRRYRSALSVSVATAVAAKPGAVSDVRVHSIEGAWSYQLLNARAGMRREELEATTRPFIETFMRDKFTAGTSLSDWYRQVDDSIEGKLHNGPDTFGDVCAAYEVAVPIAALDPWFAPAVDIDAAARKMSIGIQKTLKDVVRFYYLTDVNRLTTLGSSAALLTWASIPPANSIHGDGAVIWDNRAPEQVDRMTDLAVAHLAVQLAPIRLRLDDAGLHHSVQFYHDDQARTIVDTAKAGAARTLLDNLLSFEHALVDRATAAYRDAQQFMSSGAPSDALVRLGNFASDITNAFNTLAGQTVFVGPAFRPIAQSVFVAAATTLDSSVNVQPSAMLSISVLDPVRAFDITTFSDGQIPPTNEVAVAERLVRL